MKDLKTRVIVASEYPALRHCLAGVVQNELGGKVVGEAENAVRTVHLATTLRPDLMVVDDRLPHTVGLDGVRLSRIGGLDAALSVAQSLPNTRVLLVCHAGAALAPEIGGNGRMELCLYRRPDPDPGQPEPQVIFAALREKAVPDLRRKVITVTEKGMLVGGLGILGGLGLVLSVALAPAGVALAVTGVGVLLLSWGAGAAVAAWPMRSAGHAETQEERDDIDASLQRLRVV